MGDDFDAIRRRFEIHTNEVAAEVEAVRAVLQGLVASVLGSHPRRDELFADLRTKVLARLDTETTLATSDQDALRKAALVHERVTRIFDELAPLFLSSSQKSEH